jgi:hypothetical protein
MLGPENPAPTSTHSFSMDSGTNLPRATPWMSQNWAKHAVRTEPV